MLIDRLGVDAFCVGCEPWANVGGEQPGHHQPSYCLLRIFSLFLSYILTLNYCRGTQSSRLVRCFTSHSAQMQVVPNEAFMLAAGAVHELHIGNCSAYG